MRDGFVAAVGAHIPCLVGWDAAICRRLALEGASVWTGHASSRHTGPVLFKSCGWAGWDLAAPRCAVGSGGAPLR